MKNGVMPRSVVLACVLLLGTFALLADAPRVGVVTGVVHDADGQPMPGVTVQLISDRGSEIASTDVGGSFRFGFVIPGEYTVRADIAGFQPAVGKIVVSAGGRSDVELVLVQVAGEEIVITGEVPLINKFDVSGGGTIDAKEIEKIVAPTRSYQTMLQWLSGTTPSQDAGMFHTDVEGNSGYRNTFYVEGVDTSHGRMTGSSAIRLPNIAVGELQLTSSRADAELSRTLGAVTSMTIRSGTNDFHGDVSATFQNLAWNETYDRFPQDLPDDLDTRWEAAIGGPILRDRLWFFAAAADQGFLGYRVLAGGDEVDESTTIEPKIAKLDYRPASAHSLAVTAAETPATWPYFHERFGDVYAGALFEQGGEFITLRWSWALSDDLFLETAGAYQKTEDSRSVLYSHPEDPTAPPWSPATNNFVYYDMSTALFYNGVAIALGPGAVEYPRYQGNLALSWFISGHELKAGVDYQDTEWFVDSLTTPTVYGSGFNRSAPGGFHQPAWIRYFAGPAQVGGVTNKSKTWGVFVRDRLTFGDHWTFNLGLRLDDQRHFNESGEEVISSTDVAPRMTGVYDVWGDSRLLVTAGAARYWEWIPMDNAAGFNTTSQGRNEYDQYAWNPATLDFDIFQRHVAAAANIAGNTMEPAYKDEYTLGFEWAFHENWALKANGLLYQQREMLSIDEQLVEVEGEPVIATVYENHPDAKLDRTSVSFVVQRRFRDNWMLYGSYTWSETEGNCYNDGGGRCILEYDRLRAFVNPDTGVPWSVENRDGYLFTHAPHVLKLRGVYNLPLGKGHSLNLGGMAHYRSGRRWNRAETVTVAPGETVIHFTEKAGSREYESVSQLDVNASWAFPIFREIVGSLRVEVINATNEQAQTNYTQAAILTGNPEAAVNSAVIQNPREVRALVTLSF